MRNITMNASFITFTCYFYMNTLLEKGLSPKRLDKKGLSLYR